MLQLYDINHRKIAGLTNYKDYYIQREINQLDILSFLYPINDINNSSLKEECYISTRDNEYVIKEVNTHDDDWIQYVCKVNIDGIQGTPISHFETVEQSCTNSVNLALAGTGWTIGSCNVTKLRTVRKNNCNAYDVLKEIQTAYGCEMTFDAVNKKVNIHQAMGTDKGTYFAEELNLKKLNVQRNSYDYITRLIPLGKDGLQINDVNGGKEYIENYQYSNKVIISYWEDNRYTDAQSLLEDSISRLDYLSKPYKSYKADIFDLANSNDKYKNILDYGLGDAITLLTKSKNTKEKQRIIKLTEYPDEPERNTCDIANKIASLDALNARFSNTSDTVDIVTTSDGGLDGSKVDGIEWTKIQHVSIYTADIQDMSVVTARIGTLETTTAHITNGIIDNAKIDVANVNNISAIYATITNLNATNARIDNFVASTAQIADLAVTNAKIANAAIDNAKIANAAIGTAQIQLGAITTALIATAAIGTTQIEDGSITDAKIVGLTASKITAGTIDATEIDVINLKASNITVGTINGVQISAGAIDPTKLTTALNNTINNASSTATTALNTANGKNTVTYSTSQPPSTGNTVDDIWFDTDDGYKMYRWDGSAWVASQFGTNAIASLAITNAQIANATIQDAKISTVDAGKITTGYLLAARIAANTITSAMIAANTITASNIAAGAITADRLSVQSYGVNKILNADGSLNSTNSTAGMNFTNWTVGAVSTTGYIVRELKPFIDGGNVPVFHFYDTNASGTISTNLYSTPIKVDPNKTYYLEGWVYQASGGGQFYLGIEQLDSVGLDLDGNGPYITSGSPTVGQWIYYSGYIYPARTKAKLTVQYVAGTDTTVTVDSTAGFANSGSANIGDKSFNYTGKTATQFTGVTAGTVTGTIAVGTIVGQRTPITQSAATSGTDYEFQSLYVDKIQVKVFAAYGYSGTSDAYVYGLSLREVGGTLIDGSGLVASSITGDKIAAATITANNITANTITGDKIAANTITANNILAGTITATQIAAGTITASLIAAGAITGDMISGGTITGVILNAKDTLNVASNVWNNGTSYGITFGGPVSGYVGASTLKYYQDLPGNGGTALTFGMASGAQFIVQGASAITLSASGGTISLTGSQINLNGLLNYPPVVGLITSTTSGAINLPDSYLPNGGFATALHMASTYSGGYRQHVSIGNYRTASGWGGGLFIGLGGNDSYPTNYWLFDYSGTISYSGVSNINFGSSILTYGYVYTARVLGSVTSNDYFYIGTGNCRIDTTGGTARFQSSASNYISIDGNSFSVYIGGTSRFTVSSTGTKTGGTIDIEGTTYGMAPIDSPRQVIEDFYLNQWVDAGGTTIQLDARYAKSVAEYGVFVSNSQIEVLSKDTTSFTVKGYTGIVDIRVVGYRKDSLDYYYPVMNTMAA